MENKHSQNINVLEAQRHKKMKSNKTLLSLLLNRFHQEHVKNETLPDSDSSSHNITSHTASLHKYFKEGKNDQIIN